MTYRHPESSSNLGALARNALHGASAKPQGANCVSPFDVTDCARYQVVRGLDSVP